MEMVDWIDDMGRTRASLPREEIRRRNLLHRVSATLIFRPGGQVLVHCRAPGKDVYPGRYDVFVGGTVVSGESFELNAHREISEEMGVRGVSIYRLFDHRFHDADVNNSTAVFACVYEGPLVFQAEEVAEGGWWAPERVNSLIVAGKLCPDSAQGWRLYLEMARAHGGFLAQLNRGELAPVVHGADPSAENEVPRAPEEIS